MPESSKAAVPQCSRAAMSERPQAAVPQCSSTRMQEYSKAEVRAEMRKHLVVQNVHVKESSDILEGSYLLLPLGQIF